ncbi:MAG: universal stress protein [Bacteroidota bacterium]|nr:universal stress protein [Bacteroidota bacterium]
MLSLKNIKKILIPTDFSDTAMKAAQYAAEMAKKSGGGIFLLHVIEPDIDSIRQPYPLHDRLQEEIANNRLGELNILQKSINQMYPDIKTEIELAKGTITNSVLDFAESNKMDLIVMGTKGATGLKEIFMGSVTAGTIRRTKVPVLAIPEEYVFDLPDAILFATNHFEKNTNLLNKIVEVATLFSADVHVAVFVDTDTVEVSDYVHNTQQLNHYLDFLKKTYPSIVFKAELLEGSEFEETVEKYDVKNEVDMIAMITYPKRFLDRLMKKSVTKKMAFHSKIPVLVIPAK